MHKNLYKAELGYSMLSIVTDENTMHRPLSRLELSRIY